MTTQYIIERMAELQLKEQEARTRKAEHEAEQARLILEHVRKQLSLPTPAPTPGTGLPS